MQSLPLDEQLHAFLTKWEATRVAHIEKYKRNAERWKHDSYLYESSRRQQRYYEHELAMLHELRARALPEPTPSPL